MNGCVLILCKKDLRRKSLEVNFQIYLDDAASASGRRKK